jgi:hypothetical protein
MTKDEPGFLMTLAAWGGNVVGGAALGWAVNTALASGSDWALAIGVLALPLIFGFGMKMWYAALAGAVTKRLAGAFLRALWHRSDIREEARAQLSGLREGGMPGTNAFLAVGLVVGPLAGLLTAIGPTTAGALTVILVWAAIGVAYGVFLRWLARTGRLPPPDEA